MYNFDDTERNSQDWTNRVIGRYTQDGGKGRFTRLIGQEKRKDAAINALKAQIVQVNGEMRIERSKLQTLQATVMILEKKVEAYKA